MKRHHEIQIWHEWSAFWNVIWTVYKKSDIEWFIYKCSLFIILKKRLMKIFAEAFLYKHVDINLIKSTVNFFTLTTTKKYLWFFSASKNQSLYSFTFQCFSFFTFVLLHLRSYIVHIIYEGCHKNSVWFRDYLNKYLFK